MLLDLPVRDVFDIACFFVAVVAVLILVRQAVRAGGWAWLFPVAFVIPALLSAYHLLLHYQGGAGQTIMVRPLIDRVFVTVFFMIIVFAFLRPLLPRYRTTVNAVFVQGMFMLIWLSALVWYDYVRSWQPGTRFGSSWGALAFECFQVPITVTAVTVLLFVYWRTRSRYAITGAIGFASWTITHIWRGVSLASGTRDPITYDPLWLALELGGLVALAAALVWPKAAGETFAERYATDADGISVQLQTQVEDSSVEKAQLEQRERIAWELHDSIARRLCSIRVNCSSASAVCATDPTEAVQRLEAVHEICNEAQIELRNLIDEIRLPSITEMGLVPAIRSYGAILSSIWGIEVMVVSSEETPLTPDQAGHLYRIACEALVNAAKHGQAKRADVFLRSGRDGFELLVQDNGVGFKGAVEDSLQQPGLRDMSDRAASLGAVLLITSDRATGTIVSVKRQTSGGG